jgi:hypothetical protein
MQFEVIAFFRAFDAGDQARIITAWVEPLGEQGGIDSWPPMFSRAITRSTRSWLFIAVLAALPGRADR